MGHGDSFAAAGRRVTWLAMCLALVTAILVAVKCEAQEPRAQDEHPGYTLHVYTNLIQIPVLVLGPRFEGVPRFNPANLTVTLGDGAPFRPTHIRSEGDDPLALAILVDVSDRHSELLKALPDAMEKLAKTSLHPQDKVAIYALDCGLGRASSFTAADAGQLKLAAQQASKAFTPREGKLHRPCGDTLRLLDSIAAINEDLSQQPGRRVLLAISSGEDSGSKLSEEDVHRSSNHNGVAVFGFSEAGSGPQFFAGRQGGGLSSVPVPVLLPLVHLCDETGGLARSTEAPALYRSLTSFIKMVRERVIVEFPRPKDAAAGRLPIHVAIAKINAVILPAGSSVTIPDSHVIAEANQILPDEPATSDVPAPVPSPIPTPPQ